ncbi:MAG: CoA-binding protein [Candidatus Helarchaeota archaeon]|nr:CoA-binding protein [Candidatus Helarchaeota archaeon]
MSLNIDKPLEKNPIETFNQFFYPKSIAIVGTSARNDWFWLRNMISLDFSGKIFPVNPKHSSALGLSFYDKIANIPEDIDHVIIAVPAKHVKGVLQECILKKVKLVTIFSSGFSELGTEEGKELEQELIDLKRSTKSDIRILGPNCVGVYCPESGLSFRPDFTRQSGRVGFLSQSGGLAINMGLRGKVFKMFFSKIISFGNAADVKPLELLEYLGKYDRKTRIIGIYIEGIKEKKGPEFMQVLKEVTPKKPVIILRGGQTTVGARAALSHTGSLSGSNQLWKSLFQQTGAIPVNSFEELVETLLAFNFNFRHLPKGNNVGLLSVSGGVSVVNTDICSQLGLNIPKLSPESVSDLQKVVNDVGTSVTNPLDLAASFFNIHALKTAIGALGNDPNIDAIIIEIANHYIYTPEEAGAEGYAQLFYETVLSLLKRIRRRKDKPVLVAFPPIAFETRRIWDRKLFINAKIPIFSSITAAAQALAHLIAYSKYVETIKNQ